MTGRTQGGSSDRAHTLRTAVHFLRPDWFALFGPTETGRNARPHCLATRSIAGPAEVRGPWKLTVTKNA